MAGLGVLVIGLAGRESGLGGRYIGPDGEEILAVGVRLAHLEGGRWLAGRAGREKFLCCLAGNSSAECAWIETRHETSTSFIGCRCWSILILNLNENAKKRNLPAVDPLCKLCVLIGKWNYTHAGCLTCPVAQ